MGVLDYYRCLPIEDVATFSEIGAESSVFILDASHV
jgi:hypothetical protein